MAQVTYRSFCGAPQSGKTTMMLKEIVDKYLYECPWLQCLIVVQDANMCKYTCNLLADLLDETQIKYERKSFNRIVTRPHKAEIRVVDSYTLINPGQHRGRRLGLIAYDLNGFWCSKGIVHVDILLRAMLNEQPYVLLETEEPYSARLKMPTMELSVYRGNHGNVSFGLQHPEQGEINELTLDELTSLWHTISRLLYRE